MALLALAVASPSARAEVVGPKARGAALGPATLIRLAKNANSAGAGEDIGAADESGKGNAKAAAGKNDKSGKTTRKSGESLDSLMADVVTDDSSSADGSGKSKSKKRDDKEMDALLKGVQKADPAPVVKKAAPPTPAAPLAPEEIKAAMAQAKARGNVCAQRFGRGGTAELKITVGKDGKISDVQLGGKLAGTPVSDCIEQAVKSTTFRPNAGLRFDYRIDVR